MCLYIDYNFHPQLGDKGHHPIVVKAPIVVYKRLCAKEGNMAYSPYMGTPWTFGKEKTCNRFGYNGARPQYREEVEAGLHAYRDKFVAQRRSYYPGESVYPAVIPVGALLWIGEDDEIATNAMTVYADDAALFKALGIKSYGKGIPCATAAKWGYE